MPDEHFRFFDNREKYLLFVTTTSEKQVIADRVGPELAQIMPDPPAVRIFDAGMGNGEVLKRVLREAHARFPAAPTLVVGKEISLEDTRMCLEMLPERFAEHPQLVVVITNLYYSEAPLLQPRSQEAQNALQWTEMPLEGDTAHGLSREIMQLEPMLQSGWQTTTSPITNNPLYLTPSVMVIYRKDQEFALRDVIPRPERYDHGFDLIIAAQPYRSRAPAAFKVDRILQPLAEALRTGGRMIVIQSTGDDPGMEIIRRVWPDESPFETPRRALIARLDQQLNDNGAKIFSFDATDAEQSLFYYSLHALPEEVGNHIGTSTLLAAWNAAVYVAQIEEDRLNESLRVGDYLDGTREVVRRHGGLWFQDESFVVVRL